MNPDPAETRAGAGRRIKDAAERDTSVGSVRAGGESGSAGSAPPAATLGGTGAFFLPDTLPNERANDVIGRYRLIEEIGQGGFGTVWKAHQQEPVKRDVALKVLRLGMDTRQVIARFEQERQALALMDHPNVARVLDAGATETGRPYFVMDYVQGEAITHYSDKRGLGIAERLEIFVQICAAVQHAHGKGIIHRDLKPSNVLVGEVDDRPHATVIDFGVAKATSRIAGTQTTLTEHHQVIGTLQYMSPEQAEGSQDIDTRTDVYSLGVLLYEILTGSTPFSDASTRKSPAQHEMHRLIREVDPPKPSTRVSDSDDTITAIAARRGLLPERLGKMLSGELDWIVMKALEKDRSRRYETASDLAQDIRRFLKGEAVTAVPPSSTYRLRKLIRRHQGAVAAVATVLLALMIGVVAFAWQTSVAQAERDRAIAAKESEARARARAQDLGELEAKAREKAQQLGESEAKQRAVAETNARKATAINEFLLDMLGSADIRKLGRDARVAQTLDRAAAKVDTAFEGSPEVEADVRRILGRTYMSLGMLDEATPHLEEALALHRERHGERSVEYARSLGDMAYVKGQRGDHVRSAELWRRSAEIAEEVAGPDAVLTLGLRTDHANELVDLEQFTEAEPIFRDVLERRIRLGHGESLDAQITLNSLAVLLHSMKRLDEAEAFYRQAVDLGARLLGPQNPDTLTARMNLASIMQSRGNLAEAEPLLAETYLAIKRVFGDSHNKTASAAWSLADLHRAQGRFKDALPLLEECAAIRARSEGGVTAGVADAKVTLARVVLRLGDAARAVELLEDVVEIRTALGGAENGDTLDARLTLAQALDAANRTREAEALHEELLETCARILGESAKLTNVARNSLAVFYMNRLRYADAAPIIEDALEIDRRLYGDDGVNTIISGFNLAGCERELGRLDAAERMGRDAIEKFERVLGPMHANLATARGDYADTLVALGRKDDARRELGVAISVAKTALGATNPGFTKYSVKLARIAIDEGKLGDAETLLRESMAVRTQTGGSGDAAAANVRVELGRCVTMRRRYTEAEALLLEGQRTLAAARPAGHKDVVRAVRYLAELYTAWNDAEPDAVRAAKAQEWRAQSGDPR
jgi:eukaryotic-like serine/threonine-protein kinase